MYSYSYVIYHFALKTSLRFSCVSFTTCKIFGFGDLYFFQDFNKKLIIFSLMNLLLPLLLEHCKKVKNI